MNLVNALIHFRDAVHNWAARSCAAQPRLTVIPAAEKPVVVLDIWGQYQCQKCSWVFSFALQSAVVALVFTAFTTTVVPKPIHSVVSLIEPDIAPALSKPVPFANEKAGGTGGGDRSPLPANKGR